MENLQIFNSEEFGQIRTMAINGEPWFVGKDVADILGYQNGSRDINAHVEDEDRRIIKSTETVSLDIPSRGVILINESGLYSLILSSKMPNAKKFKHWVTSEVLPSIRGNGAYIALLINESGLYSAILGSKLESAKRFKRWATSEMFPSVRGSGAYITGQENMTLEQIMAAGLQVAKKIVASKN